MLHALAMTKPRTHKANASAFLGTSNTLYAPGAETRRCKGCKQDKSPAEFNTSESGEVCSICIVANDPKRYLRSEVDITWMSRRNCNEESADVFFPENYQEAQMRLWEPLCGPCTVRDQCSLLGSQIGSYGVWGGELVNPPKARRPSTARKSRTPLRISDLAPTLTGRRPGATMLKKGWCSRDHFILDEHDMIQTRGRGGRVQAACFYCYNERAHHTTPVYAEDQ